MHSMWSLSLLIVVTQAASAFSPAALSASQKQRDTLLASAARSYPLSSSTLVPHRTGVSRSSSHVDQPQLPLHFNVNSNRKGRNTSTSLTMSSSSTTAASRQLNRKKRIAILMSFMTGWADYIFINKYNFFATMMTGNSMKMAHALVEGRVGDTLFFLSVILSYILGVGIFRRAELSYKGKALSGFFSPIVAGCFLWSDYLTWADPSCIFLPGVLLSFSWGIINSVGSEVTGTLIFVVTGAMTRFSNMMVDRISHTAGRKKIPKQGLLMSLSVIGGFVLGAGWSVFLSKRAPRLMSHGAFSIIGGIYGLLFLWLDREALGAWWLRQNGQLCNIDSDEVDCK